MHIFHEFLAGVWQESVKTFKILSRNKMGLFGFVMTILIILMSFVGPLIWPPETSANVAEINKGSSAQHWLGTDFQGQDNLRKVINGGKDIVVIALLTGVLSMLIAVVVGSFSAFIGGRVDSLLMDFVNIWLTIPKFPLLAVLATVLSLKDVVTLSVLMAILDWPALARQVRSQVLSLKNREYIEAASMLDLGTPRIIFRELLPNMMSFIAISTIFEMTHAIYQQTGLVFLGYCAILQLQLGRDDQRRGTPRRAVQPTGGLGHPGADCRNCHLSTRPNFVCAIAGRGIQPPSPHQCVDERKNCNAESWLVLFCRVIIYA
jgi:peptide/nickel transport system permease protein